MKKNKQKNKQNDTIANTRKLTESDITQIEELANSGLKEKDIAAVIGYHENYFSEVVKHIPEVSEALKKGRLKLKKYLIGKILKSGVDSKFWTANAWLLERIFRDEFAPVNKLEHTGEDGKAIRFEVVHANNNKRNKGD